MQLLSMGESKEEDACVFLLQGGYRKLKNRCGDIRRIKMSDKLSLGGVIGVCHNDFAGGH